MSGEGEGMEAGAVMEALTLAQFESACRRERVLRLEIEVIAGACFVRMLSLAEWNRLERLTETARKDAGAKDEFDARVAALLLCDADGKRLYADPDGWKELLGFRHDVIEVVVEEGLKFNAPNLIEEDAEKN